MVATILKTEVATEISIKFMDAFVKIRHCISSGLLTITIEHKLLDHNKRINLLENLLLISKKKIIIFF